MNRLIFRTSRAFCNTLPESVKMGTSSDVVSSKLDRLIQEQKKRELQERQEYGISYVVWFRGHILLLILTSQSNKMERNQLLLHSTSHASIPLRLSAMGSLYIFFMASPQQHLRTSLWLQPLESSHGVNDLILSLNSCCWNHSRKSCPQSPSCWPPKRWKSRSHHQKYRRRRV